MTANLTRFLHNGQCYYYSDEGLADSGLLDEVNRVSIYDRDKNRIFFFAEHMTTEGIINEFRRNHPAPTV